jgi:predicted ArsR family transcriptional regulator
MSESPIEQAFTNLKIQSATAAIKALKALEEIVGDKDVAPAVRIKAIHEIITILDKAVEHLDLQEKAKAIREAVDIVNAENAYQPEV